MSRRWLMVLFLPCVLLVTFFRAPLRFIKFRQIEKDAGRSGREIAERLYLSAHILPYRLDWLHFGFITQAVRREHLAAAMNAKMGVSLRGYDIGIYPVMHPDHLLPVWPRIDKLHVISDDLLREAYAVGCPASLPVVKITPAIDARRFARKDQAVRSSSAGPLQLLTVSRLHWKKGLEYALEACALLKAKDIDLRFVIVGEGSEREKLMFLARQLGLDQCVEFKGRLSPDEVIRLMHASDIYLQPSIQEGFCNAVLEAQAAGMLCIVSDAEGLPENIQHGVTGWVVPKRSAGSIAATVELLLRADPEMLDVTRKNAAERVLRSFAISAQTVAWKNFFTGE